MEEQIAVVTGGASGIGAATSELLGQSGKTVVVADVDAKLGRTHVENLIRRGIKASFVQTDVSEPTDIQHLVASTIENFGALDIMINNAGRGAYGPVHELDISTFDEIIKLNQYGVFYGLHFASRAMIELGRPGVIVNTSSASGTLATPSLFAYNTAKAAVSMMTAAAAHDLAEHDIRVVAVAPGVVETPITQKYKDKGPEVERSYLAKHMRRQWIAASEVAETISFLCSERARAINGSVVQVDDGYVNFK